MSNIKHWLANSYPIFLIIFDHKEGLKKVSCFNMFDKSRCKYQNYIAI